MLELRAHAAAALLPDGRVLVTGGVTSESGRSDTFLQSAEIYDPKTGRFTKTAAMAEPSAFGFAVALSDGRVLVACGSTGTQRATPDVYDPRTGKFQTTGPMLSDGDCMTITVLGDGRVLFNGLTESPAGVRSPSAELFDPASGTFSPATAAAPSEPGPPESYFWVFSATRLADGRVLFVGGCYFDDKNYVSEGCDGHARAWDPVSGAVSTLAGAMEMPRGQPTVTLLPDGRVLISGGRLTIGTAYEDTLRETELYDPVAQTFKSGNGWLNCARGDPRLYGPTVTQLLDGRVLFAGGEGGCPSFLPLTAASSADIYDPAKDEFALVKGMAVTVGVGGVAVRLLDGRVLVAGGGPGGGSSQPSHRTAELFQP